MTVKSVLHIILVSWLTEAVAMAAACEFRCGDTDIPYPFGIGEGCYASKNFEVTCNNSINPPTAFLATSGNQLREVQLKGYVQVEVPVSSYDLSDASTSVSFTGATWLNTTFEYSSSHNRFTAMGCDNYAALIDRDENVVGGCLSLCSKHKSSGCNGRGCCQASIPSGLNSLGVLMAYLPTNNNVDLRTNSSVFVVDLDWFEQESLDVVRRSESVPVTLEWAKYMGSCDLTSTTNSSRTYCSAEGFIWTEFMQNVLCVCTPISSNQSEISNTTGSRISDDMTECASAMANNYWCDLFCISTPEGCSCPDGFVNTSSSHCYPILDFQRPDHGPLMSKKSRAKIIIIGCGSGLGSLLLIFGTWLLYKIIKRRRAVKLKQKIFKRNGGLLLQQQLSAKENNVEQTKVFDSKELEKATDHYHVDRILGQGGQGTVYKGMLTDGRIVAVKKSKVVDEGRLEEFINEVVILSQINHRNVVKLLGCCLETEVPLLVYEFIPNGTLFQHLHYPNDEFPITWEMRLRIAIEVARAVSYLHSAATVPIFHRDIKSTNILLDEKYRARVSDFGTSRSIAVDQTHLTTRVSGTYGYLDPEYFMSSQFTEKSDVYSFGVVLVELLTGQKPISVTRTEKGRSLATYFLLAMKEDRLFEIVDERVLKEAKKEEVIAVAQLSRRCLNLKSKKRPNMRTVATELEAIRASNGASSAFQEECEEIDYSEYDLSGPPDSAVSSSNYCSNSSASKPIDAEPLLSNK